MKSTGVVRKIDPLGRIVLPKELRDNLKLPEGTPMEIFIDGEEIILKKYETGCSCCGEVKNLKKVLDFNLCPKCIKEFQKALKG